MFPDRTANTMFFFFPRLSASSFALPSSVFAPRFQLPLLAFSLFRVFHWFSAPPVLSLSAFSILSQRFAFPRLWAPLSLFRLCSRALRVSQQRFRFQEIPVAFSLHVLKWNHYSVLACSKKHSRFLFNNSFGFTTFLDYVTNPLIITRKAFSGFHNRAGFHHNARKAFSGLHNRAGFHQNARKAFSGLHNRAGFHHNARKAFPTIISAGIRENARRRYSPDTVREGR